MGRIHRRAHPARGFTLVELLVTVAVLGIAAVVVIPQMGETGVLRVQAVARTIVADVTFAQADAMAYQTRRLIWFGQVPGGQSQEGWTFTGGPGYTIAEVTGPTIDLATDFLYSPDSPDEPLARDFSKDRHVEVTLDAQFGAAEDESANWLIFDELGGTAGDLTGPEPGPGGVIRIESPLATYEVSIEPLTGRATVTRVDE